MSAVRRAALLLVLSACRPAPSPPPLDLPRTVAVLPPTNRTGDPLLVAGTSFYEKYVRPTDRVTVPDVLAAEARVQLARRGFSVVPPETVDAATGGRAPDSEAAAAELAARGKLEGAVLYVEVRRWEPDAATQPSFVIVGLAASLLDAASGRVLWSAERRVAPVATPGEVALGAAYVTAARKTMEDLLAPLGEAREP
jgi:TolB-like protein